MRPVTLLFFAATLGLSSHAAAGSHPMGNGYNVSQERGVAVYRGEHPGISAASVVSARAAARERVEANALKAEIRKKDRALKAQTRANAELEARVDKLEARTQPKTRRSRYGRSYFGNNRFFGPNGFAGNSNFSGANAIGPVRRHYPRRRRLH